MSEVAMKPFQYVQNAAYYASDCAVSFLKTAKVVVKSVDGFDAHMRLVAEILSFSALIRGMESASKPISAFRGVVLMTRLPLAINYFVSGEFVADIRAGKVAATISSVAYAIGRAGYAVLWFVEHGVIKNETAAKVAEKLGSIPVFGLGVKAINAAGGFKKCLDIVFFVESCAFAANNYSEIVQNKNWCKNVVEIVGSTADVALSALGLATVGNPYVTGALGLVAAGSYCRAFLLDPANVEIK